MSYLRILSIFMLLFSIQCKPSPNHNGSSTDSDTTSFYVGTYTGKQAEGQAESYGIYKYAIDTEGMLYNKGLQVQSDNPSFLAKHPNEEYILAVNEVDDASNGYVTSYKIGKDTLLKVDVKRSGGAHPCHLSVSPNGDVLVANYTGGNIGYLSIDSKGVLSELHDVVQHEGKGKTVRQDAPHAHSVWFDNGYDHIYAVDLGTDEIYVSQINKASHTLNPLDKLKITSGAGPRHIAMHPNGKYIFSINELNNTIGSISVSDTGSLTYGEEYNTLPDGYNGPNTTADIHITSDGRFLYASNRGHNSIVIFEVTDEGKTLRYVNHLSTFGKGPRNFSFSPDEKFLIVANQNTHNIVSLSRDPVSGRLDFVDNIDAPSPVCILF